MISIIVPIYNSEKWLRRCIDSLLCQTYSDLQILLINDGSKDNSLDICNEYAALDSRIQVISKENSGVSDTRNMGLDKATGEYILFVDSDDYIDPNICEKLLNAITDRDLAICGLRIWKGGKILREPHLPQGSIDLLENVNRYFELRRINLGPYNKLYRSDRIHHRFLSGISLGEDSLFVFEYMRNVHNVEVLSDCMYNVVLDNENSLNKRKFDGKLDLLLSQRKIEAELLFDIYGKDVDLSKLYDQIFLTVHSIMLEMDDLSVDFIKKYTHDRDLAEKMAASVPSRWDYVLFKKLFSRKYDWMILLYFRLKQFILRIRLL